MRSVVPLRRTRLGGKGPRRSRSKTAGASSPPARTVCPSSRRPRRTRHRRRAARCDGHTTRRPARRPAVASCEAAEPESDSSRPRTAPFENDGPHRLVLVLPYRISSGPLIRPATTMFQSLPTNMISCRCGSNPNQRYPPLGYSPYRYTSCSPGILAANCSAVRLYLVSCHIICVSGSKLFLSHSYIRLDPSLAHSAFSINAAAVLNVFRRPVPSSTITLIPSFLTLLSNLNSPLSPHSGTPASSSMAFTLSGSVGIPSSRTL